MIPLYIKAFEQESQIPYFPLQAYPSLKPLASWTRDLVQRVEHFEKWASTAHPPIIFWMSAFTFPTGFLTAVLQTCARQNNVAYVLLLLDFVVFFTPLLRTSMKILRSLVKYQWNSRGRGEGVSHKLRKKAWISRGVTNKDILELPEEVWKNPGIYFKKQVQLFFLKKKIK